MLKYPEKYPTLNVILNEVNKLQFISVSSLRKLIYATERGYFDEYLKEYLNQELEECDWYPINQLIDDYTVNEKKEDVCVNVNDCKLDYIESYEIINCTDKNIPQKVLLKSHKPYDKHFQFKDNNGCIRYSNFTLSDVKKINVMFKEKGLDKGYTDYYKLVPFLSKICVMRILKTLLVNGFKKYLD